MVDLTGGRLGAEQRANGDNRSTARWIQDVQAQQNASGAAFGGMLNPIGAQPPPPVMIAAPLPHDGSISSGQAGALVSAASHSPQSIDKQTARADMLVHALGTLARKPDLTSKDVLDTTTGAIKDGHADAKEGMRFLSTLPAGGNPDRLRAAIRNKFADALLASVHLAGAARRARLENGA